jgi:hypothetical protein
MITKKVLKSSRVLVRIIAQTGTDIYASVLSQTCIWPVLVQLSPKVGADVAGWAGAWIILDHYFKHIRYQRLRLCLTG